MAWNCCNSGNTLSKFFEDALRRVQSRGRDTRGESADHSFRDGIWLYHQMHPKGTIHTDVSESFIPFILLPTVSSSWWFTVIIGAKIGSTSMIQDGELSAIPAPWTDFVAEDPFVGIAAGRSLFRLEDLLNLSELIAAVQR